MGGGRNEVSLLVKDAADTDALQALEPGVYSLHYTALEDGVVYSGGITPDARATRRTVLLTVLPEEGLKVDEASVADAAGTLASVALPDGWAWTDPSAALGLAEVYAANFTQAADTVTPEDARRVVAISIPANPEAGGSGTGDLARPVAGDRHVWASGLRKASAAVRASGRSA